MGNLRYNVVLALWSVEESEWLDNYQCSVQITRLSGLSLRPVAGQTKPH